MTSQPTLRKRSRDKPRRKKRTTALTNYSTLEDQFDNSEHSLGSSKKLSRTSSHIELPDLEEINNEPFSFSLTDSDSESEDSSRQYSSDDDTVHSTSIDLPPDLTDEIINALRTLAHRVKYMFLRILLQAKQGFIVIHRKQFNALARLYCS